MYIHSILFGQVRTYSLFLSTYTTQYNLYHTKTIANSEVCCYIDLIISDKQYINREISRLIIRNTKQCTTFRIEEHKVPHLYY